MCEGRVLATSASAPLGRHHARHPAWDLRPRRGRRDPRFARRQREPGVPGSVDLHHPDPRGDEGPPRGPPSGVPRRPPEPRAVRGRHLRPLPDRLLRRLGNGVHPGPVRAPRGRRPGIRPLGDGVRLRRADLRHAGAAAEHRRRVVLVTMGLYKLGDRIEMNQTKGYVVEITPMNTTVREFGGLLYGDSFTGRYVTIPNSQILKGNVFNYTKDTPFIWDQLTVSVTYESDHKIAEKMILEAAEDVVGPMMRENRSQLRAKYEFADLADYMAEEPRVGWGLKDSSVDLTLVYFCPVFAKGGYRTRLVKRVLEKFANEPRVEFAYPHMQMVPPEEKKVSVLR